MTVVDNVAGWLTLDRTVVIVIIELEKKGEINVLNSRLDC